jgi:hypothetical protein
VVELEPRRVPSSTSYHLDFGAASSPVEPGYTGVTLEAYSSQQGYGWQSLTGLQAVDRGVGTALTRDFIQGTDGTFLVDLPNGTYDISPTLGDANLPEDDVTVYAQGQVVASRLATAAGQSTAPLFRVPIANGQLAMRVTETSTANPNFALDAVDVVPAGVGPYTLWANSATPQNPSATDNQSDELGVKFRADVNGYVMGIRFYKGTQNTGTHLGNLWTNTGTLLASATFTGETASGWQQVNFNDPVPIVAGTTYVASYHTNVGHYAFDNYYFANGGEDNAPLHALADGFDGSNGCFVYGASAFPSRTYESLNYWVDVVFRTDALMISSNTPVNGAASVNNGTAVTVTFNKSMNSPTLNANTIKLFNPSNQAVPATVSYNSATQTAILQPNTPLAYATTYVVGVLGGANGVAAQSGMTLLNTFNSSFTTSSATGPIVTNYLSIPNFGAYPTISNVASGNWSNPAIWTDGRVPAAGDIVDLASGTRVTYDVNDSSDANPLNTLEIQPAATLTFRTDINTQLVVGNFLVLQGGSLVVGTPANPIAASVTANIVIANQAINTNTDPSQFGTGLIVLGTLTMHGTAKTPYATLSQEAHAGDTALHLASAVSGWQPGDDPILPDTRQLNYGGNYGSYRPQWERVKIQSVSADGQTVYLTAPLQYNHLGGHDINGVLDFLPQVVDDNRNVMVSSQSMTGTRGYTLYTAYANVDVEYAGFCELGRTTNAPTGSTNVADRYAMSVLDLIGPPMPQGNGYQFTFVGDEVDNDGDGNPNNPSNIQWGLALNNSYYGLIQANDVWAVAGAGIGVEDGAASFNLFDHNFVGNITGTSNRGDHQMSGDGFWFANPNNSITNNVATDINGGGYTVYSYGFDIDCSALAAGPNSDIVVPIPTYQGADPAISGKQVNMNDTPLMQVAGNEVYGATSSGTAVWWLGTSGDTFYSDAKQSTVETLTAWNIGTRAFYGYPTNNLMIDHLIVRGDTSFLTKSANYTQGIDFDDYMTRNLVIQRCDIQGMYTGIEAPFMVGRVSAMDTTTIQTCYLDNIVNIDITPPRSVNGSNGLSPQTLNIISVQFANPSQVPPSSCYNIAMNYVISDALGTSNMSIAQYIYVTNYNDGAQNFQVFYSQTPSPTGPLPPGAKTMTDILGEILLD